MTPFFITGPPRSRTSWLANLFTTDTTLCYHEPVKPIEELQLMNPGRRIGSADNTLVFHFAKLREQWPEAPWLVIERNPDEARHEFQRFVRPHVRLEEDTVKKFFTVHTELVRNVQVFPNVLTIAFENLNREEFVRQAWEHLLPDLEFDAARAAMLDSMNVQQILDKTMGRKDWREQAIARSADVIKQLQQ